MSKKHKWQYHIYIMVIILYYFVFTTQGVLYRIDH